MKEDIVVEKLLVLIERLQKRCDEQQEEIKRLTEQLEVALRNQPVRYVPIPGYWEEPIKYPLGPSDYPPGPIITCDDGTYIGGPVVPKDYTYVGGSITVIPDPDHLPYGYDPKDPLNSRSVSL